MKITLINKARACFDYLSKVERELQIIDIARRLGEEEGHLSIGSCEIYVPSRSILMEFLNKLEQYNIERRKKMIKEIEELN